MDHIQINQELEACYGKVDEVLKKYAIAKSEYDTLDDMKKTMLAKTCSRYQGSEAKIKREAEGDGEYEQYLDGLAEARENYLKAWANWNALQTKISILQSSAKLYITDPQNYDKKKF